MKIASYNIWNSDQNYYIRMQMLKQKLVDLQVDALALQEVRDGMSIIDHYGILCELVGGTV